jgi:hypothetical protein
VPRCGVTVNEMGKDTAVFVCSVFPTENRRRDAFRPGIVVTGVDTTCYGCTHEDLIF